MNNVILETERLYLKPWKVEDASEMSRILNDQTISSMLDTPYPYTIDMATSFIDNIKNRTNDYYEWKIVLKDGNRIIGGTAMDLGSKPINLTHIYIDKDYRNMGYVTEVWNAKIKYCFDNTDAEELVCAYYSNNIASKMMQQKSGMSVDEIINENNQVRTSISKENFISKRRYF